MDNLDVNIIIQTFNEKVNSLISDLVIKEAMIKQLTLQVENLKAQVEASSSEKPVAKTVAKKNDSDEFK